MAVEAEVRGAEPKAKIFISYSWFAGNVAALTK